jgi:2-polyprenyl-3-methyl-5-hydroxy-6-metoxy-1,4-benzoquinol methylase
MVYVGIIEDDRALIFDGPVTYGQPDPRILTSSNLADVSDSWEFKHLPDKEVEWPTLKKNASETLQRIELHTLAPSTERRILDFGSGWGFFLAVAKERGWVTCGLEPLPASAVYARARFGLNIITDTLHENTFHSDYFDVITSFQVFEHLPYPKEDIQQLYKSLRKDGIILIEVPNFETWTMRLMKARHRHFVRDHLNFFSINTLSQLMVNSGLEIVDYYHSTRHMSVRHLVTHWFRRYLPASMADALQRSLNRTSLWARPICFNIGDIITVIGRKLQ